MFGKAAAAATAAGISSRSSIIPVLKYQHGTSNTSQKASDVSVVSDEEEEEESSSDADSSETEDSEKRKRMTKKAS